MVAQSLQHRFARLDDIPAMTARLCEDAARTEGLARAELVATLAGEPLYQAGGYEAVERFVDDRGGVAVPLVRMAKTL